MQGRVGHFVVKAPMVIGHESAGYVISSVLAAYTHVHPGPF